MQKPDFGVCFDDIARQFSGDCQIVSEEIDYENLSKEARHLLELYRDAGISGNETELPGVTYEEKPRPERLGLDIGWVQRLSQENGITVFSRRVVEGSPALYFFGFQNLGSSSSLSYYDVFLDAFDGIEETRMSRMVTVIKGPFNGDTQSYDNQRFVAFTHLLREFRRELNKYIEKY